MRRYAFLWLALLLTFAGKTLVGALANGSPAKVNQESGKKVDLKNYDPSEMPLSLLLTQFSLQKGEYNIQ